MFIQARLNIGTVPSQWSISKTIEQRIPVENRVHRRPLQLAREEKEQTRSIV